MVKMYKFKFKPTGEIVLGRQAKSGIIMVKHTDQWEIGNDFAISRKNEYFWSNYEIVEEFTVSNHKEAVNYKEVIA